MPCSDFLAKNLRTVGQDGSQQASGPLAMKAFREDSKVIARAREPYTHGGPT